MTSFGCSNGKCSAIEYHQVGLHGNASIRLFYAGVAI